MKILFLILAISFSVSSFAQRSIQTYKFPAKYETLENFWPDIWRDIDAEMLNGSFTTISKEEMDIIDRDRRDNQGGVGYIIYYSFDEKTLIYKERVVRYERIEHRRPFMKRKYSNHITEFIRKYKLKKDRMIIKN